MADYMQTLTIAANTSQAIAALNALQSLRDRLAGSFAQPITIAVTLSVSVAQRVAGAAQHAVEEYRDNLMRMYDVYRGYTERIQAIADTGADYDLSQPAVIQMAGEFGTMLANQGVNVNDSDLPAQIMEQLIPRISEVSAYYNRPLEDVQNAVRGAFAGMSRGLKQFGIDVSDTAIAVRKARMELEGRLTGNDDADRIQAIVDIFMQQTQRAEGQVEREGGTLGGLQGATTRAWENLWVTLGRISEPYAIKLRQTWIALFERIAEVFENDEVYTAMETMFATFYRFVESLSIAIAALATNTAVLDVISSVNAALGLLADLFTVVMGIVDILYSLGSLQVDGVERGIKNIADAAPHAIESLVGLGNAIRTLLSIGGGAIVGGMVGGPAGAVARRGFGYNRCATYGNRRTCSEHSQ